MRTATIGNVGRNESVRAARRPAKRRKLRLTPYVMALLLSAGAIRSAGQDAIQDSIEESVAALQFEGRLTQVLVAEEMIVVQDIAGVEIRFNYDTDTEIRGPEIEIEALAGHSGARVRVTYGTHGDAYVATGIEILAERLPGDGLPREP